jgi:hypothetical protein
LRGRIVRAAALGRAKAKPQGHGAQIRARRCRGSRQSGQVGAYAPRRRRRAFAARRRARRAPVFSCPARPPAARPRRRRTSSALSVYFDALDGPSPPTPGALRSLSLERAPGPSSSGGGSVSGASPGASPRAARRSSGISTGGGGSVDAHMPSYTHTPQHPHHQESRLAAVPSGDLGHQKQPGCRCVVS